MRPQMRVCAIVLAVFSAAAAARLRPIGPAGAGVVNLPYQVQDNTGTTWMIYGGGWLQQQGNAPMYSQGAVLHLNQNQPSQNNNQARIDETTGEVIFENMPCLNLSVTRRIKLDREGGFARYIDIIKNPTNAEQTVNLMLQTNTNYGINMATVMNDPKRKNNQLAWIAQTSGNRTVLEMYSGKGAKQAFVVNYQQGNSQVMANMPLSIPAGKEVAVMHFHTTMPDPTSAQKWVESLKEAQVMRDIPKALRKIIVNFPGAQSFIGDYEILRGDVFDVVELRSGDQYRGTLREPAFALSTFYGPVELPVEQVIGMINVGEFRPRQLLVTAGGEIFGGKLDKQTLAIELTSGQVTQVPLAQVARMGYRKRAGEPEEWTFDKPMLLLRTGERIGIQMPQSGIALATRYGPLELPPALISLISLANEEHPDHQVILADGSRFAGLVTAQKLEIKLSSAEKAPPLSVACSAIARLQLLPRPEDLEELSPTLALANEDMLVGTLAGQLKLDTAFDTITVEADQIKSLRRGKASVQDVQVTLWDQTTVSGQLAQSELECHLRCGLMMKVPLALVEQYTQPLPQPGRATVQRVKDLVAELNAEDWKARDRAQEQLVTMGPPIIPVLKQLRAAQALEAQQRIDAALKQLEKQLRKDRGNETAPAAPGADANLNIPEAPPQLPVRLAE